MYVYGHTQNELLTPELVLHGVLGAAYCTCGVSMVQSFEVRRHSREGFDDSAVCEFVPVA